MKKLGLIGCGRIGEAVVNAVQAEQVGDWSLISVLTRHKKTVGNLTTEVDPDAFFGQGFNLIVDTAGPGSMAQHGVRVLEITDLWTVNAAALVDPDLFQQLKQTAEKSGHRLRLLAGAIAGLDGISTLSEDEHVKVFASVDMPAGSVRGKTLFSGGLKEAAEQFPGHVNVAVASGVAAGGLDRVQIVVNQPGPGQARKLGLTASSKYGTLKVETIPNIVPDKGINMVAACIVAALRQESQAIWVG